MPRDVCGICRTCKNAQLTKCEVSLDAGKMGFAKDTVEQPFCHARGGSLALQFSILECEDYIPSVEPKELLKPAVFAGQEV